MSFLVFTVSISLHAQQDNLKLEGKVVSVASIAREEAEAANEQAAARKLEEQDQRELREGSSIRKAVTEATVEPAPQESGTPDQVVDLIQRAEEDKKRKEGEANEDEKPSEGE